METSVKKRCVSVGPCLTKLAGMTTVQNSVPVRSSLILLGRYPAISGHVRPYAKIAGFLLFSLSSSLNATSELSFYFCLLSVTVGGLQVEIRSRPSFAYFSPMKCCK